MERELHAQVDIYSTIATATVVAAVHPVDVVPARVGVIDWDEMEAGVSWAFGLHARRPRQSHP
jgi:hypothetical protein